MLSESCPWLLGTCFACPVKPRATQCSASLVSQHPPCIESSLSGPRIEWDPWWGLRGGGEVMVEAMKNKGLSVWSCWQGPCCGALSSLLPAAPLPSPF